MPLCSSFNLSLPEDFLKSLILHKLSQQVYLRLQRKMRVLTAALCLMDSTKKKFNPALSKLKRALPNPDLVKSTEFLTGILARYCINVSSRFLSDEDYLLVPTSRPYFLC